MTEEALEMVAVPRAEVDELRAEVRRLRREVARYAARERMNAAPGPVGSVVGLSQSELARAWGIGE